MTRHLFPAALSLAAMIAAAPALAETWQMSAHDPDGNFHTENVRLFAEDVAEKSGGALTLDVKSNAVLLSRTDLKRGVQRGHVALLFLVFYSAMELVLDSTRYDSSFLRLTGFVSLVQIVSAVSILLVLIYYSRQSVRANGLRPYHWLLWVGYFATLAATGAFEYLVQRHGNWYLLCYSVMSVSCLGMAVTVLVMYRTLLVKRAAE